MQKQLSRVSGLIEQCADNEIESDVKVINSLVSPPPKIIIASDVYMKKCWLAGDALNSHYGRFHTEDIPKLLNLVQGAPLMEMHNTGGLFHGRGTLPIGRFFGGSIEKKEVNGEIVTYVVPKFYWMVAHSGANDLKINIEGGIYTEASIGFYYEKTVCSICGKDIMECSHILGEKYKNALCFYWYQNPVSVLEGSIVYRGAHPGTQFENNEYDGEIKKKCITVINNGIKTKIGII
jgi:hypothetical protein